MFLVTLSYYLSLNTSKYLSHLFYHRFIILLKLIFRLLTLHTSFWNERKSSQKSLNFFDCSYFFHFSTMVNSVIQTSEIKRMMNSIKTLF